MSKMIHYQDDLFAISVLVRSLDLTLSTEADPEFFSERIDGDIAFIAESLQSFGSLLEQNNLLIERPECLKLLQRNHRAFIGVLEKLSGSGYPNSAAYSGKIASAAEILRRQKAAIETLNELLRASLSGENETDIVSQDELSELLKG
jgi:hypothetical protein